MKYLLLKAAVMAQSRGGLRANCSFVRSEFDSAIDFTIIIVVWFNIYVKWQSIIFFYLCQNKKCRRPYICYNRRCLKKCEVYVF